MSNKALITRRLETAPALAEVSALQAMKAPDIVHEADTPAGMLMRGTDSQFEALEAAGYRVKLLPDTNLLSIGRYIIDVDTDAEPDVPRELDISQDELPGWPHHLVQLAGPPLDTWVRAIEARGLDVVEPISGYGLFVSSPAHAVTALRDLPFVVWTGPLKPAYRISSNATANVEYLSVGVYPSSEARAVRAAIEAAEGRIVDETRQPAVYGGEYAIFRVQGASIEVLARVPHVRWVEPVPRMEPDGERESQILAENLDGTAAPATAPVPGYQSWLTQVGVDGSGVTIAIVDSGVDANADNATAAHLDLRGRQAAFVDYSSGAGVTDTVGHGTHVAGIALGNAATAQTEAAAPGNFLWGQGVAPGARYVTQNPMDSHVYPRPSFATLAQDSAQNGATVMNNSWGATNDGGDGYVAQCREVDLAVRDPNATTSTLEPLAVVFSAGNAGGRPQSITAPHESKNAIIVGNSLTSRPGQGFPSEDIRGIAGTSSRGPAVDMRILPTIVAPGTDVSAPFSRTSTLFTPIPGTGAPDPANAAVTINQYTSLTGTSQAAPQVAGACAVITEWWRNRTGGKTPSPAMLKALLVNSAENLAGGENWRSLNAVQFDKDRWGPDTTANVFRRQLTFVPTAVVEVTTLLTQVANAASITSAGQWAFDATTSRIFVRMLNSGSPGDLIAKNLEALDSLAVEHIPNNDQGWGRLSLANILLQSPASDRGPGIYSDQRHAFTADGQELLIKVAPVDTARPLRITLAYTDAVGSSGSSTNMARLNDLDLEVKEVNTGRIFKGNVFQSGFSVTGGSFDGRNNVECVYVQQPLGVYEVRVIAGFLVASANPAITTDWQDFALVIDNADVPDGAPVNVATVLDRSSSMTFFGYVDITRICTRQFIDLMGVGDHVGLVSFGDDARVEFPPAGTAVEEITGQPVKDTAMAAVTNVVFAGCTAMGDGIASAAALLSASPSPRAIVLFSDGYDNKGCAPIGSPRPSALQAAQALPSDVRLFSCAMGPASDQALLESLAAATSGGRYYFMPAIDELFEVYNYIRGQVSGTSVVVNQQGQASSSVVPAFIDAAARAATFTVAWADPRLRAVPGDPQKPHEVGIRLLDAQGKLVPTHASFVRRHFADTFAVFRIEDPAPGRWHVQVQTLEDTHVDYTAGVFVDSPVRLVIAAYPRRVKVGDVVQVGAVMLDGAAAFAPGRAAMTISAPNIGLREEIRRWRRDLNKIEPPPLGGDTLPVDVARLAVLNTRLKKGELFARGSTAARLSRARFPWDKALPRRRSAVTIDPNAPSLAGGFQLTQPGSYNITVTVSGVTPSGARFVRTDRLGVVAR